MKHTTSLSTGKEKPTGPACAHGQGGKPRKAGPAQACQLGGENGGPAQAGTMEVHTTTHLKGQTHECRSVDAQHRLQAHRAGGCCAETTADERCSTTPTVFVTRTAGRHREAAALQQHVCGCWAHMGDTAKHSEPGAAAGPATQRANAASRVASALRIHNPLGGLFGNWGLSGQLGPNLAPVITQVFSANNAGAKPLNGYALLNRHATRFPVADGSGRNVQLFSHNRAAAKVAGGPVKRVLAWNDGKRIDLHSRILTRGVFIGQHHMFTQPVFNAAT